MADPLNKQKTTTVTSGVSPNALAKQLSKAKSQDVLDEIHDLVNNSQYARDVPEDTRQALDQAVTEARKAYNAKVSQNEWLDVAQTLGRAVAQFGAAQAGMAGGNRHNMSNLNMGQPIDYNSRSDRAFQEYQQELKSAQGTADQGRQRFLDTETSKQDAFKKRYDYLSDALKTAREHEADDERFRRAAGLEKWRQSREDTRSDQRDRREDTRTADAQRKLEYAELTRQEQELQKQEKARASAANNTELIEDLNKKSADKLQAGYGKLLAEGGLDIDDIKATKPSLFGLSTSPDPKKSKEILKAKVEETKNLLDGIRARKKELISGGGGRGPDPKIREYADQYKLSYDEAKKVLVGRGYKPAE